MEESKIKKVWKKYKTYFIAPFASILILLIIYAIKGIYPFGTMTIANADLGQAYMPFYHFLYDIVYNGKSIFYDYTLGIGSNMYGGFVVDGLLNPTSWIVLLSSRENIPYMFSFVLMIKIALISLSSYILFSKLYKENTFYNIIFSVLYAFSGYVLTYNTNIMWLDIVGIFPLFILATKYMFETHKIHWFVITLALILISNYNLAFMVLMFIILIVPIYIILGMSKETRKRAVFDLIISTGLAIGLSAFALLPSFVQVINSYRMAGTTVNFTENANILLKLVIFLFYVLPVYGFINWIQYYEDDKKYIKMHSIAFLLTALIPIMFERVNLMWHTGSYKVFAYRYGFIPILILSLGALRYFDKYSKIDKANFKQSKILNIILVILFIIISIIGLKNADYLNGYFPAFLMPVNCFIIIAITLLIKFLIIANFDAIKKQKIKRVIIAIIVLVEVFTYSYAYIGVYPERRGGREWSDEEIFTSYELEDKMNVQNTMYRVKDLTGFTTENCSLVHNIPSMSTFLHIISDEQVLNYNQMGYSALGTKLNDYGGTIFSDAVYGIKYVLSKNELSEKIYNYLDTTGEGIKIYEYKNTLPIGITYENEVVDIPENLMAFDAQNYLYKKMFNKNEDIIEKIYAQNVEIEKNRYIIEVKELSELYIYTTSQMDKITVNGETLIIPTVNVPENTAFPTGYGRGILDLGTYENETVEIEIERNSNNIYTQFGILDIQKYNKIFEEKTDDIKIDIEADKIKVTGYSDKDTKIFIPINYDDGWKISKESKQNTEIKRVYNNFIGLEIKKGEVDLELKFRPLFYKEGVILTVIAIGIMSIYPIIEKKFKIFNNKVILNIVLILGILMYIVFCLKIYVIPIIETFIP